MEVPTSSSSSSSSSRNTRAQGKQQSQPQKDSVPPIIETPIELATDQASASSAASGLESLALAPTSADADMSLPIEASTQPSSTSWADITAQEEDEEHKSMDEENVGIQTGDQQRAWAKVLEMTDDGLRRDPANIDRSKLFTRDVIR